MTHAVMRGSPTKAQLYLENIITELVQETGRPEDRHSLNRILFKCLRDHPDRMCLIDGKTDERVTNMEMLRSAVRVARALCAHGVRAGEVAVAMAQNHVRYAALYYGALFAGVTLFNLETILTAYEIKHYIKLTKTAVVFADSDKSELMKEALKDIPECSTRFVVFGQIASEGDVTFSDFIKGYSNNIDGYWPAAMDRDAVPLLFTTGGSTGLGPPKVVPLTNTGMVSQIPTEWPLADNFPLHNEMMLMIFHGQWAVHAFTLLTGIVYGAVVLVQSQNPNAENLIDLLRNYKPTWILIAPPEATDILKSPKYRHGDLHSLTTFLHVGVAAQPDFINRMKEELNPGALLCNRYGMTEAHGYVCLGDKHESPILDPPINLFLYKIVDKKDNPVGCNEAGELYLKSDYSMAKTYYGDDEAARNMYTADGWFRTGDLVREDQLGRLHYVDRLKFIVFNNGYPVSPAEIERVVCSVEGVSAAVVVGREDAGPAALVVTTPGAQPTRDAIKEAVKATLNPYKHLSGVAFIDALPRTVVGKIHRRKCAEIIHQMIANKQCY